MRALLHILQYPPDVNPTGTLLAQVAEGLAARGHEVGVVTTFPHYGAFRMRERRLLPERSWEGGVRIDRLPVFANGRKEHMPSRFLSYASFAFTSAAAMAIDRERWDVVLTPNGSFFSTFAAMFQRKLRGVPYVLNVQDLYPDAPVEAGVLSDGFALRALLRMERSFYGHAAHVTVITEGFRQRLTEKGVPASKLSVIPNFVDTTFIRPLPRQNPVSGRLGLDGRLVVAYSGNFGHVYDFRSILAAATMLRDREDVLFLLVGGGALRPDLEAAAQSLPNVRVLPFLPRGDLPHLRASTDIHLSLYRRGASRHSLASKTYEILASGRPMIVSSDEGSELQHLVEQTGAGLWIPPENPHALVAAIRTLGDDRELRAQMGKRARAYAEAHVSEDAAIQAYEQVLMHVAAGAG